MAILFPVENPEEKKLKKLAEGIQRDRETTIPKPPPVSPFAPFGPQAFKPEEIQFPEPGQERKSPGLLETLREPISFLPKPVQSAITGSPIGAGLLAGQAGLDFLGEQARRDPIERRQPDITRDIEQFRSRPALEQLVVTGALDPSVAIGGGETAIKGARLAAEVAPDVGRAAKAIGKEIVTEEGGFARLGDIGDEIIDPVTQTTPEIRKEITKLKRSLKKTPDSTELTNRIDSLEEELHVRAPRFKETPLPPTKAQAEATKQAKNVTPEMIAQARRAGVPVTRPDTIQANVLGLKPIIPGLTKQQELGNIAKDVFQKLGGKPTKTNPIAAGALNELHRVRPAIESQANRIGVVAKQRVRSAFKLDKQGRVPELEGIDPSLVGAPTIPDIAARMPVYEAARKLTPKQVGVLDQLRREIEPFNRLMRQLDIDFGTRTDIITEDGGFYLPRGRAGLEGPDAPIVGRGSALKEAVFGSQTEGISAGFTYAPVEEALSQFIRDAGNRSATKYVSDFFKSAVDESGKLISETPKVRMLRQNKDVAQAMVSLRAAVDRLTALGGNLTNRQQVIVDRFINDPNFDDIDALRTALASVKVRSGLNEKASIDEVKRALILTKNIIKDVKPEYKAALERAKNNPLGESGIDLRGLEGVSFDDAIAKSANSIIEAQGKLRGKDASLFRIPHAFNNMYRSFNATGDNSAPGIQGLLALFSDPKAFGGALKTNAQAWVDESVLGKFIENFDQKTVSKGRLSSSDWATHQLRIGGSETEFELGQGITSKASKLPFFRNANRAFGFFGDSLRLSWADDLLQDELRRGRSLEELRTSGALDDIAEIANKMTGYSKNRLGSLGDLLLFAPRFLAARLETVAQAGMGLRPGATLEQRIARKSMLKMIAYGAGITEAINLMLGNETDRNLLKDGRFNTNFYTIRYKGRDRSIFGTWSSLLGLMVNVGTGHPDRALRSLGSGVVSNAWDFLSGEDVSGKATRDTPMQVATRVMENFIPFVGEEFVDFGQQAIVGEPAVAAFNTLAEFWAVKSSPITTSELEEERQIEIFGQEKVDKGLGPRDIARVRQEPDIKQRREEFEASRKKVPVDTQLQFSFDRLDAVKATRGKKLEDQLNAGQTGKLLRKALTQAKTEMFLSGQALFTEEAREKLTPDENTLAAFRQAYWTAPVEEDEETGLLNFATQEEARQTILLDAAALDFDPELVKERPIWFPENPVAQEALDAYNNDLEELRSFWTGTSDMVGDFVQGEEREAWDTFTRTPSTRDKARLRQQFPVIKQLEQERTRLREQFRSQSPLLDQTLIFWEFSNTPFTSEGDALLRSLQQ